MRKILLILWLAAGTLWSGTITVAAAANVTYAMDALKKAFHELYPQIDLQVTIASSGKLTAQIRHGAPYDLLLSADMKFPQALFHEGLAVTRPLVYAQGSLVLLSTRKLPVEKGLAVLKDSRVKRIAVANPKTAPYGIAAEQVLRHSGLYDTLKPRFIFGESVGQTLTYALKAADAGLVAKSALMSPKLAYLKKGEAWIDLDPSLYTPIDQGIVLLKRAERNSDAAAFFAFMFTKKARSILKAYGYQLP